MWFMNRMEFYAAIENKISTFVGQEIELEIIKWSLYSEILFQNKNQKDKVLFFCHF